MKKYFFFLIVITSLSVAAQNAQGIIDNLKKELKAHPDAKNSHNLFGFDLVLLNSFHRFCLTVWE